MKETVMTIRFGQVLKPEQKKVLEEVFKKDGLFPCMQIEFKEEQK